MILRIVKLPIRVNEHASFVTFFNEINDTIRSFEGCLEVNAYPEQNGEFYFTVSKWNSEKHLAAYRNSTFFKSTWRKTKKLFEGKAEAWSLMV